MNKDLKTIPQIAADIGVSRQAVHQKIKRDKDLSTRLQAFTSTVDNAVYVNSEGQKLILQAFESKTAEKNTSTCLQENVDALVNQLTAKDKQISDLSAQNASLTATIQQQADTIQQLSAQLTAAQQLQAGTVKALLTEQSKQEQPIQQAATFEPEHETEIKQGFFSRLFRKKNK